MDKQVCFAHPHCRMVPTCNSFSRHLKDLPKIYKRRLVAEEKLESAKTQLLQKTVKLRLSEAKRRTKPHEGATAPSTDREAAPASGADDESTVDAVVLPREQRPQHRLGWLPFIGKKVDTIDWARGEIPPQNSAFVMFHEQIAAHLAKQSLLHHKPYLMRAFSFVLHVYVQSTDCDRFFCRYR